MRDELDVTIRRLTAEDRESYIALVMDSFGEELVLSQLSPETVKAQVNSVLTISRPVMSPVLRLAGFVAEVWVAQDPAGTLVGCYSIHGRRPLVISTVATVALARGRGVGRKLMEHALDRARQLKRKTVVLEVLAENEPAVRLYRSLGMRVYDERKTFTAPLPYVHPTDPVPERIALVPVQQGHLDHWLEVLATSVPSEALQFEQMYRSDYMSRPIMRWMDEHNPVYQTTRRSVLIEGRLSGFLCVRASDRAPVVEVLPPLLLSSARPHVSSILAQALRYASESGLRMCRVYTEQCMPEIAPVMESLRLTYERSWLYMYKQI